MKFDKSQLLIYAVTDRAWTGKMSLYEQTEAALKGGATMVQLREKGLRDDNVEEYLEEAKKMRALTEKYNVPLLFSYPSSTHKPALTRSTVCYRRLFVR